MSDDNFSIDSTVEEVAPVVVEEEVATVALETLPADNVSLIDTFRMRPRMAGSFPLPLIRVIVAQVLETKLKGKNYHPTESAKWVCDIADTINTKIVETISTPRFKHVVQVHLAQQMGSGCFFMARMCWDAESDDHVSEKYSSLSLVCVCTVFGVYQY